jgi:hypothetical protein
MEFTPKLPDWKTSAIQRLGFGLLNKVALLFPETFWPKTTDFFGHTHQGMKHSYKVTIPNDDTTSIESDEERGEMYIFWNLYPVSRRPVLVGILAGKAAYLSESESRDELFIQKAMTKLKRVIYTFLCRLILLDVW